MRPAVRKHVMNATDTAGRFRAEPARGARARCAPGARQPPSAGCARWQQQRSRGAQLRCGCSASRCSTRTGSRRASRCSSACCARRRISPTRASIWRAPTAACRARGAGARGGTTGARVQVPHHHRAWMAYGDALVDLGQYDDARVAFERARLTDPQRARVEEASRALLADDRKRPEAIFRDILQAGCRVTWPPCAGWRRSRSRPTCPRMPSACCVTPLTQCAHAAARLARAGAGAAGPRAPRGSATRPRAA